MTMKNMHVIHIFHYSFFLNVELGVLVSGMSIIWEDNDGCEKPYMCSLDIYLMTVL